MNRAGVLESSPVQQLVAAGNPNWWSVSGGGMKPPPPPPSPPPYLPSLLPQFLPSPSSSSSSSSPSSWPDYYYDLSPESWSLSQLLFGGLMMGEEERMEMMRNGNHHHSFHGKKLENWEEQVLLMSHQASSMVVDVKQETHNNHNNNGNGNGNDYHVMSPNSPPNNNNNNNNNSKSCVTTTNTTTSLNSSGNNSMLDFSSNHTSDGRHPPLPDTSSHECHSSETGGGSANKKPRLQASPPSTQSSLKVRKEKLGGRIAALHQLVSPFGKTDTASVLSEAIGYIRFLHSQIEALSLPYFGTASGNMRHQQHVQGDRNCMFSEDPGQLVNENCMKKRRGASDNKNQSSSEEPKTKDMRSRGLCLVPISFTLQVGSDNGAADYWAPALGAGFR